eukprot:TRINITY_DN8990_c0_g1_i1.p1 TRINITY_DN8990_c0_g1~~TRINITY_DN8990_c0_g1_i1.p1  ORF type:complete len:465 (-),score=104.16 TRINITY_DN8990_c0_g1_i1:83-1477(-)
MGAPRDGMLGSITSGGSSSSSNAGIAITGGSTSSSGSRSSRGGRVAATSSCGMLRGAGEPARRTGAGADSFLSSSNTCPSSWLGPRDLGFARAERDRLNVLLDRGLRRDLREEVERTRDRVDAFTSAAAGNIVAAGCDQAEARCWDTEAGEAFDMLSALDRELEHLRGQRLLAARSRESRLASHHEERVAQSRAATDALAELRAETKEAAANSRAEARRLENEVLAEQRAATEYDEEVALVARSAAEAIGKSARRAAALLRPRGDLLHTRGAIDSTVEWLVAVDAALQAIPDGDRGGGDVLTSLAQGSMAFTDTCEAVKASASVMAVHWRKLAQGVGTSSTALERERSLIEDLHRAREESHALEEELDLRRAQIDDLRADVAFEDGQTQATLKEQRWLVPRVASAVEGLGAPARALARARSCGGEPSWEQQLRGGRRTWMTASSSPMVSSPVAWAGFHCDRAVA